MSLILSKPDITEIEKQYNVVHRGYVPNGTDGFRRQMHTCVKVGPVDGWLFADGTLVIPFIYGCWVFDPVLTAASAEALDALLRSGDVANENKEEI